MHYKDGTEVKLNNLARTLANEEYAKTSSQNETIGIVVAVNPGATSCNLSLQPVARRTVGPSGTSSWIPVISPYWETCTASDCLLVA